MSQSSGVWRSCEEFESTSSALTPYAEGEFAYKEPGEFLDKDEEYGNEVGSSTATKPALPAGTVRGGPPVSKVRTIATTRPMGPLSRRDARRLAECVPAKKVCIESIIPRFLYM